MFKTGLIVAGAVMAVSGCASGGGSRYAAELAELQQSCTARDGVLVLAPTPHSTGRPQADYICRINGGSGRLMP